MTRPRRRSRFRSRGAAALAAPVVAVAIAAGVAALPRVAPAQACCVGTGLGTAGRLRVGEDRAAGMQMRARSVMGAFSGTGGYATSAPGYRDVGFEEDLFGSKRFGSHFSVGLSAPFVQPARESAGLSGFGGGLGDAAATARFDVVNA